MIGIRFEGDPAEEDAIIARMREAGIEVQVNRTKPRGAGVTHQYAIARLSDMPWPPAGLAPIRVDSTLGHPVPALPAASRPVRRRRA